MYDGSRLDRGGVIMFDDDEADASFAIMAALGVVVIILVILSLQGRI